MKLTKVLIHPLEYPENIKNNKKHRFSIQTLLRVAKATGLAGLASAFENIKPVYNDLGNLCALDIDGKQIAVDALAAALTQAGLEVLSGNSLVTVEKAGGTGIAPPASNDVLDSVFELPDDVLDIPDGGFRDMMPPEEAARYDDYWNGIADDLAKNDIQDYRNSILNGDITKTTGGKINSKVITVGVDINTGDTYYGISGMNNNPTRSPTSPIMQDIIDSVGTSQTNFPLENCGEFNVVNNAIQNGVDPHDLRIYSIDRISGQYKAPCVNCENLYGDILHFIE